MDSLSTLAASGSEAATESPRQNRRAAAPPVQPLRPNTEFMTSAVANDLAARVIAYHQNRDGTALIRQAYAIAREAHEGQQRASGEPYIDHPVEVANILINLRLDAASIAAALLHDVVEDTSVTKEQVEQFFGREIAHLVDGVTKLSALEAQTKEEAQAGTYRKMFAKRWRSTRRWRTGSASGRSSGSWRTAPLRCSTPTNITRSAASWRCAAMPARRSSSG